MPTGNEPRHLFSGNLPLPLKEMIVSSFPPDTARAIVPPVMRRTYSAWTRHWPLQIRSPSWHPTAPACCRRCYQNVVRFASKVVADANGLEDEDFEELMEEGFTREEICEIIAVIDMATMFNVYTSSLRLDLDPQYRAIL